MEGPTPDGKTGWRRLSQRPWLLAAPLALLGISLWTRLLLQTAPPYGDEDIHFIIARLWMEAPPNFRDVFGTSWWHPGYIFFQRPAFYVLFHLPAQVSFDVFRLAVAIVGAFLPLAVWRFLASCGVPLGVRLLTSLVVALHPFFVNWSGLAYSDPLMTIAFLMGAAEYTRKRWLPTALWMLLAMWSKETAIVGAAILLLAHWQRRLRAGVRPWPISLDRMESGLVLAIAFGALPLILALERGLPLPGGTSDQSLFSVLEVVTLTPWLLAPALLGLRWRESRAVSVWALSAVGFFLALNGLAGRAVQGWYALLPASLMVGAAATSLLAAWQRRGDWRPATAIGAIALLLVVGAGIAAPETPLKNRLTHPFEVSATPSLSELVEYQLHKRDQDMVRVADRVLGLQAPRILLLDVRTDFVYEPYVVNHPNVVGASSRFWDFWPQPLEPLAAVLETNGTVTVLESLDYPLNKAVRDVYADCIVLQDGAFWVIEGWRCPGRLAQLQARVPYPMTQEGPQR